MKKLTLLSVFVILALALVACAPEDTEPAVGTPGIPDTGETPAPGMVTPDPMVTPMETPVVTPAETPVVTPPAAETPVTPAETPATTPETTPGAVDIDPADDPNRASNLLGRLVRNMENENLGDIEELIISIQNEQIIYAVIGRGGFLGIGEDLVAVPYEALTLTHDPDDADDYWFVLDVDEEAWDNAPALTLDEIHFGLAGWQTHFDTTWLGTTGTQPQVAPGQTQQPGMAMELDAVRLTFLLDGNVYDRNQVTMTGTQPAVPATPAQPGDSGTPATPATPAQPGATVVDYDRLGEIEEVVVNAETGEVRYVVIDADRDTLAIGEIWIPVPMSSLQLVRDLDDDDLDATDYDVWILVDRQQLVEAPAFEVGALPDTRSPQWDSGIRDFWGTQGQ
jgi:sporulation protein YlmC with PRC-barrel domain